MRLRTVFALLGMVLASFYIFWNNFYVSAFYFLIFSILLSSEFSKVFKVEKVDYFFALTSIFIFVIISVATFLLGISPDILNEVSMLILFANFFIFSIFLIMTGASNNYKDAVSRTVKQLFISFYIILFFFHFLRLKHVFWFQEGRVQITEAENLILFYYTFFPFFFSWVVDASAFFAGKLIGGKKLGLSVSPNKTWSGLVTSFICGAGGIILYRYLIVQFSPEVLAATFFDKSIISLIFISLFFTFFCLFGDLIASLHKRSAQVKDSGEFLKGHGGFYDRMDSTIILNFVFYYFVLWL